MKSANFINKRSRYRFGLIQLEVVISALLLGAVISCIVGMNYRLLGVVKQTRHYQIALHEAANQIEQISSGGLSELDDRIAMAKLTDDILESLPKGKIAVQRIDDQSGTKVTVRIGWDQAGNPTSVELTGWVSTKEKPQ